MKFENNSVLNYREEENIEAEFYSSIGCGQGTLKFINLRTEYNMSRIKCEATYRDDSVVRSVEATLLLVQG